MYHAIPSFQVILAFPTNQFGHQENSNGQEIVNSLKHVRPGNGFEPKCIMFDKVLPLLNNAGAMGNVQIIFLNRYASTAPTYTRSSPG